MGASDYPACDRAGHLPADPVYICRGKTRRVVREVCSKLFRSLQIVRRTRTGTRVLDDLRNDAAKDPPIDDLP